MSLKRISELTDPTMQNRLQQAKITPVIGDSGGDPNPAVQCPTPYLQDGKPYRLEPKPKGRESILIKYGHEIETIDGILHARVPLGTHGTDHIGLDPDTKEIGCVLCNKVLVKP